MFEARMSEIIFCAQGASALWRKIFKIQMFKTKFKIPFRKFKYLKIRICLEIRYSIFEFLFFKVWRSRFPAPLFSKTGLRLKPLQTIENLKS